MPEFFDNDDDVFTGKDHTPIRKDAFDINPDEKIEKISGLFAEIMQTLGMDMSDDSLKDSPKRVAKMYVNEIFGGLLPENKPRISTFSNKYKYRQMLVEKDITVYSFCEHHFLPIVDALREALGTKDVACIIEAKHLCVNCRGIKDTASSTTTAELSGLFRTNPITRQEFLHYVGNRSNLD